jgi:hypothetical protein
MMAGPSQESASASLSRQRAGSVILTRGFHALALQPGAEAAGEDRDLMLAAHSQADHIVSVAGHDDPDRHLPANRGVARVEGLGSAVEPDLSSHGTGKIQGQAPAVGNASRAMPAAR